MFLHQLLWRIFWAYALGVCFGRMLWACVCFGRMLWAYGFSRIALGAPPWAHSFGRMSLGV